MCKPAAEGRAQRLTSPRRLGLSSPAPGERSLSGQARPDLASGNETAKPMPTSSSKDTSTQDQPHLKPALRRRGVSQEVRLENRANVRFADQPVVVPIQSYKELPLWWKAEGEAPKPKRQGSPAPRVSRGRGRPDKLDAQTAAAAPAPPAGQSSLRKAPAEAVVHDSGNAKSVGAKMVRKDCEKPSASTGPSPRKTEVEAQCEKTILPKVGCDNHTCENGPEKSQPAVNCQQQSPAQVRLAALRARVLARIGGGGGG